MNTIYRISNSPFPCCQVHRDVEERYLDPRMDLAQRHGRQTAHPDQITIAVLADHFARAGGDLLETSRVLADTLAIVLRARFCEALGPRRDQPAYEVTSQEIADLLRPAAYQHGVPLAFALCEATTCEFVAAMRDGRCPVGFEALRAQFHATLVAGLLMQPEEARSFLEVLELLEIYREAEAMAAERLRRIA